MVSPWDVLDRLEQFIDIDESEKDTALAVCVINLGTVRAKLKKDIDLNDVRITQAAAAMSLYDLAVKSAADGKGDITSFKAGDVTVSRTNQSFIEYASKIKSEALSDLSPLLNDNEVYFVIT